MKKTFDPVRNNRNMRDKKNTTIVSTILGKRFSIYLTIFLYRICLLLILLNSNKKMNV